MPSPYSNKLGQNTLNHISYVTKPCALKLAILNRKPYKPCLDYEATGLWLTSLQLGKRGQEPSTQNCFSV